MEFISTAFGADLNDSAGEAADVQKSRMVLKNSVSG
jgi:hypothetical protein